MVRNIKTHLTFIDPKKAYGSIPQLWPVMKENGVSNLHIRAVEVLCTNITSYVKIVTRLSEDIPVTEGLQQGCANAPILFKVYLNTTFRKYQCTYQNMGVSVDKLYALLFANDQVIMAEDEHNIMLYVLKITQSIRSGA